MHDDRQEHSQPAHPAQRPDGLAGSFLAGNGKQHGRADDQREQQAGIDLHAGQHRRGAQGGQPRGGPVVPAEEQAQEPRRQQRRHGAVTPGGKDGQPKGREQIGQHGPGQCREPCAFQQVAHRHTGGQNCRCNHHQKPCVMPAEDLHHTVLQRRQHGKIVGVAHVGIHVDGETPVGVQLPDDAHPVGIGVMIGDQHVFQRKETPGAQKQPDQQGRPQHPLPKLPLVQQEQHQPCRQRGQTARHEKIGRHLPQRQHDHAEIGRQQHPAYGAQQRLAQPQRAHQRHPRQRPAQQRGKIPSICHCIPFPSG